MLRDLSVLSFAYATSPSSRGLVIEAFETFVTAMERAALELLIRCIERLEAPLADQQLPAALGDGRSHCPAQTCAKAAMPSRSWKLTSPVSGRAGIPYEKTCHLV